MSMPAFRALMTQSLELQKLVKDYTNSLVVDTSYSVMGAFEENEEKSIDSENITIEGKAVVFLPSEVTGYDPDYEHWAIVFEEKTYIQTKCARIYDKRTGALHHYELTVI